MKLIKTFIVHFERPLEENFQFEREINQIKIKFQDIIKYENKVCYLFSAEENNIQFELEGTSISIAEKTIDKLVLTIEDCTNIISVSKYNGRRITSTNPSMFLEQENNQDLIILKTAKNFLFKDPELATFSPIHKFDLDFCFDNLIDRYDGVKIFSEAISAKTYSDKLREYFRLFEIGFKKSNRALIEPLFKFLAQNTVFNYRKDEISNWINIRHKTVHANHKQGFLINRNLYSSFARIEQAAVDILFNKEKWNNADLTRRELYNFKTGVKETGQVYSLPNLDSKFSLIAFDETHTFPMDFVGGYKPENIPNAWWYGEKIQA